MSDQAVLAGDAMLNGLVAGWLAMVEACMGFAGSGERDAAFDGWDIAAEGGGVCNGRAECEGDRMTFIVPAAFGSGAVTVSVGAADWVAARPGEMRDARVADAPRHMTCASAEDTRQTTEAIRDVHGAWIADALSRGRLVEGGVFSDALSGPYLGCGYDGRPYQVEFSLHRTGAAILRLYHPAREAAAEGAEPKCAREVG